MKLSLRTLFWGVFFALCVFSQGCVGMVRYRDMSLQTRMHNPSILNLHNYSTHYAAFFKQDEKLIRGSLIKNEGEEYGYYVIVYKNQRDRSNSIFFWSVFLGGLFAGIPQLFGFPTDAEDFYLSAYLYIFDCNGRLVSQYKEEDSIRQTVGLYYGHNPTKKVQQKYSELYEKIFRKVSRDAEDINKQLLESGPIVAENIDGAKDNIGDFFKSLNNE